MGSTLYGWCCFSWRPFVRTGLQKQSTSDHPLLRLHWGKSPTLVGRGLEAGISVTLNGARYVLCNELGRGAHCTVWHCTRASKCSRGQPAAVALKSSLGNHHDLEREYAALRQLGQATGVLPHSFGTVSLFGRMCLALPVYGPNLYTLQKERGRRPFAIDFAVAVAAQLLEALQALTSMELVHADIKPQNIVLRSTVPSDVGDLDRGTQITLIDLGSCVTSSHLHMQSLDIVSYIQSRWYRAPEVLLGAPCSSAIDIWSVGCVVAEIALGLPLFPGESEYNCIVRMHTLLGAPPAGWLATARRASCFFVRQQTSFASSSINTTAAPQHLPEDTAALQWILRSSQEGHTSEPDLIRYLPCDANLQQLLQHSQPQCEEAQVSDLTRFIHRMLTWDPEERHSAQDAGQELQLEVMRT